MQGTERLGASSRCYVAPVGTKLTDGGWMPLGHTVGEAGWLTPIIDRDLLALQDRINQAAVELSSRHRWVVGASGPHWWPQSVELPSNISTRNERSKPVGLTREYRYTDNDGDFVEIDPANRIADPHDVVAVIETGSKGTAAYIKNADSVPLALNVLGHDRPELARDTARTATAVVRGDGHRDELLAQAAANLRAIDLYDQHVAKKKVDEAAAAKAAEIAAAKARVEVANREIAERHLRKATGACQEAIAAAFWVKVTPERAAKLQSALSAYETARRKVEGLPS